jgi:hypothetical protein
MIQCNSVSLIEKRFKLSKRLGNEIQLLKTKCGRTNDFHSRTELLIEKYMKLIRKYEQIR